MFRLPICHCLHTLLPDLKVIDILSSATLELASVCLTAVTVQTVVCQQNAFVFFATAMWDIYAI